MAAPTTEVNPYARRSLPRRVADALRRVLRLPGDAYRGYRDWPRSFRRLVIVLGVVAGVFAGYAGVRYYLRKSAENQVTREWVRIEQEFRSSDTPKIVEGLDRILVISPNDVKARKLKTALETGRGDPHDVPLMLLLFREHQKNARFDDLAREATERLALVQHDYYAHFMLARIHLMKQDFAGAQPHLKALADPESHPVNMQFDAIAWAMGELGRFGYDTNRLRAYTSPIIMKLVQAPHMTEVEPAAQAMLLHLYGEIFELPQIPPNLSIAWPASAKLAELCHDGAKLQGDVGTMGRLASLGPRNAEALGKLLALKQVTPEQSVEWTAESEDRTIRAWQFVVEKQPKTPEAYNGLMLAYIRTKRGREAVETLMRGLDVCGDNPQLLEKFSQLSILNDKEIVGYERVKLAAERNPDFPKYWLLAAHAAAAGDRRDLAFDALSRARAALPDEPQVFIMQASLANGTGQPERVLDYLSAQPDAKILAIPAATAMFVRALAEVGDEERLDAALATCLATSRTINDPRPAILAASGLHAALPATTETAAKTAEYLVSVIERWNIGFPAAAQLHAAALVRVCELQPGAAIDPVLARNAIIACEKALAVEGNHIPTLTSLLLLRLLGDKDPEKALSEVGPLTERLHELLPEQAEVLGRVFNANKKYDEALRAVARHTQSRPTAGCWTQMAVAYVGQGRTTEAQAALDRAAGLSKSDRDHAEYLRARDLLTRVSP